MDEGASSNEKVKKIAQEWKEMKDWDRAKLERKAKRDRERYRKELREMSQEAVKSKIWVARKAPHISKGLKLKRPRNAFMLFYQDKIDMIKTEYPELPSRELSG